MTVSAPTLQRVEGFEASDYALLDGRLVWLGEATGVDHPRNARHPWSPPRRVFDAGALHAGALRCRHLIDTLPRKGLLLWLGGEPLPFPLEPAAMRFDAIRDALSRNDIDAFAAAATRVLGLGPGLTPSGDDFVGGILFALAHAPRAGWAGAMPALRAHLRQAARRSTNVISAALLDDLIDGASYAPLHALLAALQEDAPAPIERACRSLLSVGATSGADMLAGLLLALLTLPSPEPHSSP